MLFLAKPDDPTTKLDCDVCLQIASSIQAFHAANCAAAGAIVPAPDTSDTCPHDQGGHEVHIVASEPSGKGVATDAEEAGSEEGDAGDGEAMDLFTYVRKHPRLEMQSTEKPYWFFCMDCKKSIQGSMSGWSYVYTNVHMCECIALQNKLCGGHIRKDESFLDPHGGVPPW